MRPVGVPTGHVFRVERVRGPVWYAKYRLPDGRQVRRKLGPAWTERGRPPGGWFTKRTAEAWLREVLDQARRNAHLLPAFGDRALELIEPSDIEEWRRSLAGHSNRSKNKPLILMHGVFRRAQIVWGLAANPLARVEKHPMKASGDIQVFSPERCGPWAPRAAARRVRPRVRGETGSYLDGSALRPRDKETLTREALRPLRSTTSGTPSARG
jgi:hypothetical protein